MRFRPRAPSGRLRVIALLAILAFGAGAPASLPAQGAATAQAPDPGLARLQQTLASFEKISGGRLGIAAIHLETGREVYLNRGERFPMASTFKVPVAVELLTRVDLGHLRLDSMVAIQPEDLHPGSGTLADLFNKPGVTLSVRNLLELMLLVSDNSATDVMLRLAGGGEAVTTRMRALGVEGVRVDRPTSLLIGDFVGVKGLPATGQFTMADFRGRSQTVTPEARTAAEKVFNQDPRDTSTPEAMGQLLRKIWRKEALSPSGTELLLDIMRRCRTGADRLKGMLPPGTEVMHKTGTIGGTANDVGIIALPQGAGHVVVAAFIKESTLPEPERVKAIAHAARAIHDYFTFNP